MEDVITKLKDAITSGLASEPNARREVIKAIDKANVNEGSKHYLDYLKDKKDATYAEAKKHIAEKIAGWKLSEEDFEEAKKII